jgi:hypothetical protein
MVDAGGLISYDPFTSDLQRRVAAYVDKIRQGRPIPETFLSSSPPSSSW